MSEGDVEQTVSPPKKYPPRWLTILKQLRYVESFLIVGFSTFIIFYGILNNQSAFSRSFPGVAPGGALVIFILLLMFFCLLEGSIVSLVSVSKHPNDTFRQNYSGAVAVHKWVSEFILGSRAQNLPKFLMGRQVMVILTQFFLSSLVAFPGMDNFPFTDAPFPEIFKHIFVDTGLLNVTFVTIFGSLLPMLIATRYPVQWMNMLGVRVVTFAALVIEATGIAHFSWVLNHTIAHFFRMDSNVSKRVMGEVVNCAEHTVTIVLKDDCKQFPELKNAKGKWRESYELAQEWAKMGYKPPVGASPDYPDLINKMLKIAETSPRHHIAATNIVFTKMY